LDEIAPHFYEKKQIVDEKKIKLPKGIEKEKADLEVL